MSVVREELGPSLPQLAGPTWSRLRRWHQIALIAVVPAGVLVLVAAYFVLRADPLKVIVVRKPIAFNLIHRADFNPVTKPGPGEILRLEGVLPIAKKTAPVVHESFVVRPLTLPPYTGDISASYLLLASRKLRALQAADPNLRYRGEGKTRINLVPGYQLTFQTRNAAGRLVFGKYFFLVPEADDPKDQTRVGVELELRTESSGQTPNPVSVGGDVLLKAPLRSFRFGTERP